MIPSSLNAYRCSSSLKNDLFSSGDYYRPLRDSLPCYTVKASATFFPLLIHELAKGVLEALSLHGLPESTKERHEVLKSADNVYYEAWDLRVGKGLWPLVNAELPRGKADRNLALSALFRAPAKEYNSIITSLLEGDSSPLQELTIRALGR